MKKIFSIFVKKSTIHVDCFTYFEDVYNLFPPIEARHSIPSFYKNLSPTVEHTGIQRGTMKTCPGVNYLFNSGFIVPNCQEIFVKIQEDNDIDWFPAGAAESHNSLQWGAALKNYHHLKIVTPWLVKENTGTKFLMTNLFWHDNDFKPLAVNGMLEFKYQHSINVNLVIPKNIFPRDFSISPGKELAQVIPLTDKTVKLHTHLISIQEYQKMGIDILWYAGNYLKRKKLLQSKGL